MSKLKNDINQMQLNLDFNNGSEVAKAKSKVAATATILNFGNKLQEKNQEKMVEAEESLLELYTGILKGVDHIK